eukprot:722524-Rhodomonas_salina.1
MALGSAVLVVAVLGVAVVAAPAEERESNIRGLRPGALEFVVEERRSQQGRRLQPDFCETDVRNKAVCFSSSSRLQLKPWSPLTKGSASVFCTCITSRKLSLPPCSEQFTCQVVLLLSLTISLPPSYRG